VEVRDGAGGFGVVTSIPSSSLFARHGGPGVPCSYVAATDGVTSDGRAVVAGESVVSSRWVFREGSWAGWRPTRPDPVDPVGRGPLAGVVRWFQVFCDTIDASRVMAVIGVPVTDPVLDPRSQLQVLVQGLRLERPMLVDDPVVARWGGLVVRHPVWMAVAGSGWRVQTAPPVTWRGWTMDLVVVPRHVVFEVGFVPATDRPSPAFSGIVPCLTGGPDDPLVDPAAGVVPTRPALADTQVPGVNGACTWTPPGPGTVTIQARVTYTVTFRANGWTEPEPDEIWTSPPVTYQIGELSAVDLATIP
jgi:hypothetical protein